MKDWTEKDCKHVGRSMAYFLRMFQTGDAAVDAWRINYPQLDELFQVDGFNEFIVMIANNLLRDNKFGMMFRVSIGAALSTLDAVTDIYVITTYFQSKELFGQAIALLAMINTNMLMQIVGVLGVYQKKSWGVKLRETLLSLLFLRPAVDAYRVSTNHEDDETTMDSLSEMVMNKCCELATKSIPSCVLQMYVWLNSIFWQFQPFLVYYYLTEFSSIQGTI